MTTIAIDGIAHQISDDLKRNLSDALLREVKRCAEVVATHTDDEPIFGETDRSASRAAATRDGMEAQRMHGSLWGYDATEAEARWNDALHLTR